MENQKSSFNRRKFLTNAAKVAGVGAAGYIYLRGCNTDDKAVVVPPPIIQHEFLTQPYLHTLDNKQMYIRWITNRNCYSWVEYGETDVLDKKVHAITDGLVNSNNRVHEIFLQNLIPGKTYHYRVASKEMRRWDEDVVVFGETIYSKTYTFRTIAEDADEINFLVLNDLHDMPSSFPHLLQLNGKSPYDFVFLNGDMFNFQSGEAQIIQHLITPCTTDFAIQKPLLFVRGNHELRGPFAHQLKDYFSYPQGYYFHFQYGPLFAIAIDTGEDKEDDKPVYAGFAAFDAFREKQALWIEKLMQSEVYRNARYKVVFMHIPPFYSNDAHGSLHSRQLFSPLFDKYKVDLVVCGHTHVHGVHPPVKGIHDYPIVIGGGPLPGTRTLIKVDADQVELKLQMLDDSGKEVGTYSVKAK
jgi:3',5'-cyclic AMP phosphodiesterase CpdA